MVKVIGSLFFLQIACASMSTWANDATETHREISHEIQALSLYKMSKSNCESSCDSGYFRCKNDLKKCAETRATCYRGCKRPS
jgi:hypothetical protein